jgi:Na+/glutamate symporter
MLNVSLKRTVFIVVISVFSTALNGMSIGDIIEEQLQKAQHLMRLPEFKTAHVHDGDIHNFIGKAHEHKYPYKTVIRSVRNKDGVVDHVYQSLGIHCIGWLTLGGIAGTIIGSLLTGSLVYYLKSGNKQEQDASDKDEEKTEQEKDSKKNNADRRDLNYL